MQPYKCVPTLFATSTLALCNVLIFSMCLCVSFCLNYKRGNSTGSGGELLLFVCIPLCSVCVAGWLRGT